MEVTVPGGTDTSIYLSPGQLPSDIDPRFSLADTAVSQAYRLIEQTENIPPPDKPYDPGPQFIIFFVLVFAFIIYKLWKRSEVDETYSQTVYPNRKKSKRPLTYYGDELDLSEQQLAAILTQRFPYYNKLSTDRQEIFLDRLQKFISEKTFRIHDEKGFKEMPVLISAAAIQLTFGLKRYLLPHFRYIIYTRRNS
jgi:hypothetical protein